MEENVAKLYLLDVRKISLSEMEFLSSAQQKRAMRFVREEDRLLYIGARRLEKSLFPEQEIKRKINGKPYIEGGAYFSISHSYPYVGILVIEDSPVGLDIESRTRETFDFVAKKFLDSERRSFPDLPLLWCLKEAVYKCQGTGYMSFEDPITKLEENKVSYRGADYFVESFIKGDHQIVCCSVSPFTLAVKDVNPSEF